MLNKLFQILLKKVEKKIKTSSSIILFLAIFFSLQNEIFAAEKAQLKKVQFNKNNHIEITLSQKTDFKVFTLQNPERLVIDFALTKLEKKNIEIALPDFVKSHRNTANPQSLRLVFDLNQRISLGKSYFQGSKNKNEEILLIDILGVSEKKNFSEKLEKESEAQKFILKKIAEFDEDEKSLKYVVKKDDSKSAKADIIKRIPVIVIDSGHGGKDPGTIGNFARTKEKNITLSYAKELGKQLSNTGRYKVYLTRDDDRFIPLRKRVEIARKKKADLFISLHANSISDEAVYGFSIYTLSEKSSDKQAELLAQKENRADIISGINFSNASQDIMKTLIDLSQRETMNGSSRFSSMVIKSMQQLDVENLENTHRFAGFAVLTAPDMASVLIELGYLSNKEEEKLLNSLSYKRKIAIGLTMAIDEYFAKNKT